jgi:glycosyltransferase involved in cell wall biosynthesis
MPQDSDVLYDALHRQHQARRSGGKFLRNVLWRVGHPFGQLILYGPAVFGNPYQTLIYSAFRSRVSVASIDRAEAYARLGISRIYHLHWDDFRVTEGIENGLPSYVSKVRSFRKAGGKLIWTVHNSEPHGGLDTDLAQVFRDGRSVLCDESNLILVHNSWARDHLVSTYAADSEKIRILPHPSYTPWYPQGTSLHLDEPTSPHFLVFGSFRENKGLNLIIEGIRQAASKVEIGRITVAGSGCEWVSEVSIPGAKLDVSPGFIADSAVAGMFTAADFSIFGFSKIMTSGSVALALSYGCIPIVPDLPPLRADLPAELLSLSYRPGDSAALAEAVLRALSLSQGERAELRSCALELAQERHPLRISSQLEQEINEMLATV